MPRFVHPEPAPESARIWPVFLPFAGCPHRCAFCAQQTQTGEATRPLQAVHDELEQRLGAALAQGRAPLQLAFYGGTFTGLPDGWPECFLALARRFRDKGLVTRVRCSTRPDMVSAPLLAELCAQGLDMVELGVQSFDDAALAASGRGHDAAASRTACALVRAAGLSLGIQLLPGMPGVNEAIFAADVAATVALAPDVVRLYPCLVVRGTELAARWERGEYAPWPLDAARQALARAVLALWRGGARVIRLGLAPQPGLDDAVLAGPWHPAFGSLVRATALHLLVGEQVRALGRAPVSLSYPRRHGGEFWGHKKDMVPAYAALGLSPANAVPWDEPDFLLE